MLVDVRTKLQCSLEDAVRHVRTPRLLDYVAAPLVRFVPETALPEQWSDGTYWVRMYLLGWIPLGRQAVVISTLQFPQGFCLRDNGHSAMISRWDHVITIEPAGEGVTYRDRVDVDAGVLTPMIWMFAQAFYRHRQRRWSRLVASGFSYA